MPALGGTCSQGVSAPGGGIPACTEADPPGRDGYCCGRYASYWNAFLYSHIFFTSYRYIDQIVSDCKEDRHHFLKYQTTLSLKVGFYESCVNDNILYCSCSSSRMRTAHLPTVSVLMATTRCQYWGIPEPPTSPSPEGTWDHIYSPPPRDLEPKIQRYLPPLQRNLGPEIPIPPPPPPPWTGWLTDACEKIWQPFAQKGHS